VRSLRSNGTPAPNAPTDPGRLSDCGTLDLAVYCVDAGSVLRDPTSFGWARAVGADHKYPMRGSDDDISKLVKRLTKDFTERRPVALGFECPLYVPVPEDHTMLGTARSNEGDRAWSAFAGAYVLATGLVQAAWVLSEIRPRHRRRQVFLDWTDFWTKANRTRRAELLFLWEAFAPKQGETRDDPTAHVNVAKRAVRCFTESLPDPRIHNAVSVEGPSLSLIGAAAIWSGWSNDPDLLKRQCLVLRVPPKQGPTLRSTPRSGDGFPRLPSHQGR
jgi:hypothetical protein